METKVQNEQTLPEKPKHVVMLDGWSLTVDDLISLEQENTFIDIAESAWDNMAKGRKVVDNVLQGEKKVYGINTGFGLFANVKIDEHQLRALQENLIRSHASGVGQPLAPVRVRRLLVLRINVLCKGRSGIRPENVKKLVEACNKWCLPMVPEQGTVGASGDLAPLSHLCLGLMGEGKMWNPTKKEWGLAADILKEHNVEPIQLEAKEGLAMINGTQFIMTFAAEALSRAENLSLVADVCGAMTLEALKGTVVAFGDNIHKERPHKGQRLVARRLLAMLHSEEHPSEISISHKNCGQVQDPYTLRCMPQVHGVTWDTIQFCKQLLETEMNSATDNPMVFHEDQRIISGGNFHGEYPAKAADYLAIGVHELSSISERRIERLVNPSLSSLPAFLVKEGGLNSGFMIAHCAAAALVSENKSLCHPASVDSIPTSGAKEDHVSMGGWAARKAVKVVENVENVLAVELLCACQGIEFLRPLKTTPTLEAVHALVRSEVKAWDKDRYMAPDIEAVAAMIRTGRIREVVTPFLNKFLNTDFMNKN